MRRRPWAAAPRSAGTSCSRAGPLDEGWAITGWEELRGALAEGLRAVYLDKARTTAAACGEGLRRLIEEQGRRAGEVGGGDAAAAWQQQRQIGERLHFLTEASPEALAALWTIYAAAYCAAEEREPAPAYGCAECFDEGEPGRGCVCAILEP